MWLNSSFFLCQWIDVCEAFMIALWDQAGVTAGAMGDREGGYSNQIV